MVVMKELMRPISDVLGMAGGLRLRPEGWGCWLERRGGVCLGGFGLEGWPTGARSHCINDGLSQVLKA